MKNREIADILYEMGDLLELRSESRFKILAYRKAARSIESMKENIEQVWREGNLRSIPGVGSAISEKIEEYLTTGKIQSYERMEEEMPPGLSELLKISGLGPKTIVMLHEKLGVSNIDELERAAREHRIRRLPRMGATSEANILKAVERYRKRSTRIPLGVALPIVDEIMAYLLTIDGLANISTAGSLRRGRDTVGDIDILATSMAPEAVITAFVKMPIIDDVLSRGTTKASVIVRDTVQVDLRIVDPKSYGTLIQYFTGSKEHNVKLREIAKYRGYKLSEYSLARITDGVELFLESEEDVYSELGMQYIPPELREDTGEIEAAIAGKLPDLVELSDIQGDLHVHSDWSDGLDSIEVIADAARGLGYSYAAICDHSPSLGITGGLTDERLLEKIDAVSKLNQQTDDFRLLAGTEVDIRADGRLDYPDDLLERCDVVVAAVHTAHNQKKREITKRIINAVENEHVDIIAHPTGRIIGERDPYEVEMEAVFDAASRTGTFMEINAHPKRLDLNDLWARKAKEMGVKMVINTDAHSIENLVLMKYGVKVARRGWLEKGDLLNTAGLEELLRILER